MTAFSFDDLAFMAGQPWTPAYISTLLWLDASDGLTLYDATSGGSLVTANNAAIARWEDKSGNAYHLTQSTASRQVALVTSAQNSLNGVQFVDDALANTVISWASQAHSIFIAHDNNEAAGTGFRNLFCSGTGATGNFSYAINSSPSKAYSTFNIGLAAYTSTEISSNDPAIISYTNPGYTAGTFVTNAYLNGSNGSAISSVANSAPAGAVLGSNGSFSEPYKGNVYELILVASVVSTNTRQIVEGYLAHKWGLAANLPSDHPYKTSAP